MKLAVPFTHRHCCTASVNYRAFYTSIRFDELTGLKQRLNPLLLQNLTRLGMVHASHIQHQALPAVLSGANVLVAAETGSGKTLTYGIPAIENTLNARDAGDRNSKVLVLLPNHELCRQVHGVLAELSRGSELALGIGAPAHDTDVTLCTPGALGRWSNAEVDAYLPSLQLVCLDEADMLVTALSDRSTGCCNGCVMLKGPISAGELMHAHAAHKWPRQQQ